MLPGWAAGGGWRQEALTGQLQLPSWAADATKWRADDRKSWQVSWGYQASLLLLPGGGLTMGNLGRRADATRLRC